MTTSSVGPLSIFVAMYCGILFLIQACIHKETSKILMAQSYASLLILSFAAFFITLTYYAPYLKGSQCFCHPLWGAALVFYVSALYLSKAMYISRIQFIIQGYSLGSDRLRQGVSLTTATLSVSVVVCLSLMVFRTDGVCHPDRNEHGCLAKFDFVGIHSALVMIFFDACFFSLFCVKWYNVIKDAESVHTSPESSQITQKIAKVKPGTLRIFIVQFALTIIAMSSCIFDAIMHLILYNDGKTYHVTMIYFLVDCFMVGTCNFLMIREAQQMVQKIFKRCTCCNREWISQKLSLRS